MASKKWIGTASGFVGDYGEADNWEPSGVPVNGDDVIFADNSQDILAGFDQSLVILNSITFDQSYTGVIGSNQAAFLQVAAATAQLGQRRSNIGTQTGSQRLNLDFGSTTACAISIFNSGSIARDPNRQAMRLRMLNAGTTVDMFNGSATISDDTENASTLDTAIISDFGSLNIGNNVTISNVTVNGGVMTLSSSITGTAFVKNGSLNHYDGLVVSTLNSGEISGGIYNSFASGTISALLLTGGVTDLTKTQLPKTVTTLTIDVGATLITDSAVQTITSDIKLPSSGQFSVSIT